MDDNDEGFGFAEGRCIALTVENQELMAPWAFAPTSPSRSYSTSSRRKARGERDTNGYRQLYSLLDQACERGGNPQPVVKEFQSVNRPIFLPSRPDFPFAASDEVVWKAGRRGAIRASRLSKAPIPR